MLRPSEYQRRKRGEHLLVRVITEKGEMRPVLVTPGMNGLDTTSSLCDPNY